MVWRAPETKKMKSKRAEQIGKHSLAMFYRGDRKLITHATHARPYLQKAFVHWQHGRKEVIPGVNN